MRYQVENRAKPLPPVAARETLKSKLAVEVVRRFGEVRLRVTGASMLPSVWPGDILTVRRVSFSELRPGQIILCSRGAQLVAHRIIGHRQQHLVTRGDSLPQNDPLVGEDQVLGQVVSILRNGRRIDPSFTQGQRMAAWVLRRSDFAARVLLRLRNSTDGPGGSSYHGPGGPFYQWTS